MQQTILSKSTSQNINKPLFHLLLKETTIKAVGDSFTPIVSHIAEIPACEVDTQESLGDGLIGIISFVGAFPFSLVLGLPKSTAGFFSHRFLGFEIEYDTPDMRDLVGEMVNLLAGSVTAFLEKEGACVHMSLPTVACGSDLQVLVPDNFYFMALNFRSYTHSFWVKIVTMPGK